MEALLYLASKLYFGVVNFTKDSLYRDPGCQNMLCYLSASKHSANRSINSFNTERTRL